MSQQKRPPTEDPQQASTEEIPKYKKRKVLREKKLNPSPVKNAQEEESQEKTEDFSVYKDEALEDLSGKVDELYHTKEDRTSFTNRFLSNTAFTAGVLGLLAVGVVLFDVRPKWEHSNQLSHIDPIIKD